MRASFRILAVAIVLGAATAACDDDDGKIRVPPPPAVKTMAVSGDGGIVRRSFAGALAAAETIRLSFAVSGKLIDVPLREGEPVRAGQVVARLDPVDVEREIAAAEARLKAAQGQLDQADQEFRRQQSLYERGFAPKAAFDRASAEMTTARSQFNVAQAELKGARLRLSRTVLAAPIDGIVARQLAKQSEEVAVGTPVYEISTVRDLQAEVLVPEEFIGRIDFQTRVVARLAAFPDRSFVGRIGEIAAEAESGNAFRLKARLDDLPEGARAGMSASVTFEFADAAGSMEVPLSALRFDSTRSEPTAGSSATVFVVDPDGLTASRRALKISGVVGNNVLVAEGLAAGELVVTAGVAFLQDGQRVRIWQPPQ